MTALPTVVRRESGAEELFVLTAKSDHPAFQGHFPGDPILPGVIQVDWAIRFAIEAFGPLGDFQGLSNLKFMSIIRPEEILELRLTLDRAAGKLGFRFDGPTDRKSSGVVIFSVGG
jgi:3-hydroxymyristoyl/3-hydroxydecanoyl-(acyl carrier protein) dehydratase